LASRLAEKQADSKHLGDTWRLSWGVQFVDRSAAFQSTRSAQKPNGQRRVTAIGHSLHNRLNS
jgi:hypothetical protein